MMKKIYLTIGIAAVFLWPSGGLCQGKHDVFDQFIDADVDVFQGTYIDDDLTMESRRDTDTIQGINVIVGYTAGTVLQQTIIKSDLSLLLAHGDDVVQGINIYQGDSIDEIFQTTVVNGTLTMKSKNNSGGIQGINVITASQ